MSQWSVVLLAAIAAGIGAWAPEASAQKRPPAPETFTSPLSVRTESGATAARIDIVIDRYTPDGEQKTMSEALRLGGYPGFLQALRKAPAVGRLTIGADTFTLRWARAQPTPMGRAISLVTDVPVYFVGGGRTTSKPRDGFEIAIVQLAVDEFGFGTGTMAAAARVKPDGSGGVAMEDYAEKPISLTYVRKGTP
jgi:hypothetical protein